MIDSQLLTESQMAEEAEYNKVTIISLKRYAVYDN